MRSSKFSLVAVFGAAGLMLACLSLVAAPRSYWRAATPLADSVNPDPQGGAGAPANGAPSSADATKQAKAATDAATNELKEILKGNGQAAEADKLRIQITAITGQSPKRSPSPSEDLQTILSAALAVQSQKESLISSLTQVKSDLDPTSTGTTPDATRRTACDGLTQYSSLNQQDVTDAQAKCSDADKQATDGEKTVTSSLTQLQAALTGMYGYLDSQVAALNAPLKPLATLQPGPPAQDFATLTKTLPPGIVSLKQAFENQDGYQNALSSLKTVLQNLSITVPAAATGSNAHSPDVDMRLSELQTSINGILPNLEPLFESFATGLNNSAKGLDGMLTDVASKPAENVARANNAISDAGDPLEGADSIVSTWPLLLRYVTDGKPDGFHLKNTKTNFGDLQKAAGALRASISRMHDAVGGDMSKFETDQVSLYYFTDVARLMRALNEKSSLVGGLADTQANNKGFIADWVFSEEHGEIHRCSGGASSPICDFSWDDCCAPLQSILSEQAAIHADGPCPGPAAAIQVTFKIDLDSNAMEVCLA